MKNLSRVIANKPDFAETAFQLLCDQSGVVRNKAVQDRTGWDFLVELDRTSPAGTPLDEALGASTARVQVKSKTGGKPYATVKLSNAVRFAREPDFCFLVLYHFAGEEEAPRIYACHFHKELIEKTLRRVREVEGAGGSPLNKIQLRVPFGDADEHTHDLLGWIQGICGSDPVEYARDKQSFEKSVGFEAGAFQASVKLGSLRPLDLIDHAIGLSPQLPVQRLTLVKRRFGIGKPTTLFDDEPSSLKISAAPHPAKMRMLSENGTELELKGEFRVFGLPGLPGHTKASFIADPFRVVFGGGREFELEFELIEDHDYSLSMLAAMSEIAMEAQDVRVAIMVSGMENGISFSITTSTDREDTGYYEWLAGVCGCLSRSGSAGNIRVSRQQLESAQVKVTQFVAALTGEKMGMEFNRPSPVTLPEDACLRYFVLAEVADRTFYAVCERRLAHSSYDVSSSSYGWGVATVLESGHERVDREQIVARLKKRLVFYHGKGKRFTMTIVGGELDLTSGVGMAAQGTRGDGRLEFVQANDLIEQ